MSTPVVKEVAESTTHGDERPSKKSRSEGNGASTSKHQPLTSADLVAVTDFSDASDRSDDEDEETAAEEKEDSYDEDDSEDVSDDDAEETEPVVQQHKDAEMNRAITRALPGPHYSSDDALDSSDFEADDNEPSDVDVDS